MLTFFLKRQFSFLNTTQRKDLWSKFELTFIFFKFIILILFERTLLNIKKWIHDNIEDIINHPRNHLLEQQIRFFNTWVCVDLNQDGIQLLVNNKIVAQKLKSMFLASHFTSNTFTRINDQLLHFIFKVLYKFIFHFIILVIFFVLGDEFK